MKEITQLKLTRKKEEILYASLLSSVISTFITNPIEVAKLNYQFFPLSCKYYPHQNYIQLITCECSKFSLAGSVKSLKIAIPQVLFSNMIFMQIYEQSRQTLLLNTSLTSPQATFLSSIFGRFIVVSLMIPFQSLRIRFSNEIRNTKINFHGYKITMTRDLIYSGLYWTMLESYRNEVVNGEYRGKIMENDTFTWKNFSLNMLPGFIFGMLTSAVTTPMDTLKTRIQSQGITKYKILQGIADIHKKQGLTGLFSGVEWRMLKSGLHSSLYVCIYEWYMRRVSYKHTYISGLQD